MAFRRKLGKLPVEPGVQFRCLTYVSGEVTFAEVLDLTLKVVERWFDVETFTEFPFDPET